MGGPSKSKERPVKTLSPRSGCPRWLGRGGAVVKVANHVAGSVAAQLRFNDFQIPETLGLPGFMYKLQ